MRSKNHSSLSIALTIVWVSSSIWFLAHSFQNVWPRKQNWLRFIILQPRLTYEKNSSNFTLKLQSISHTKPKIWGQLDIISVAAPVAITVAVTTTTTKAATKSLQLRVVYIMKIMRKCCFKSLGEVFCLLSFLIYLNTLKHSGLDY